MTRPLPDRPSAADVVALGLSIGGGVLLFASYYVVDMPPLLIALTAILLAAGLLLTVIRAYRESRRDGVTAIRALGRAARRAGRWFVDIVP